MVGSGRGLWVPGEEDASEDTENELPNCPTHALNSVYYVSFRVPTHPPSPVHHTTQAQLPHVRARGTYPAQPPPSVVCARLVLTVLPVPAPSPSVSLAHGVAPARTPPSSLCFYLSHTRALSQTHASRARCDPLCTVLLTRGQKTLGYDFQMIAQVDGVLVHDSDTLS